MSAELTERVNRESLRNVKLLGPLDPTSLRSVYRQSDIFLFPSVWEGSPKVVLEAAACGLPVIVRNSYAPETVLHGITGYQAASDDEIVKYLDTLIANRELRRNFGHAGRAHSTKFDWDVIAREWEQAFTQLAQSSLVRRAS
jgi:glycosyltransferase involved in cell wall biosynthesis